MTEADRRREIRKTLALRTLVRGFGVTRMRRRKPMIAASHSLDGCEVGYDRLP